MSKKQRGLLTAFIFVLPIMLVSACTQSLSNAPAATPTLIPDGLFVSPFPSVENPMAMIEEFAKQTAAAQTTVAGGAPGTPSTPSAILTTTPQAATTGTVITPQSNVISTPTSTPAISTPTNANTNANVPPPGTAVPAGTRPKEWILQAGEWPYCIARRFDVDPDALITASGLINPDIYYVGQKLIIPQSGSFPGPRVLMPHPATYTAAADDTVYGVSCKFGDVYPDAIAAANGISVAAKLTAGQQLKIP